MYPPKLYSGPTIQSRSAARRAAQDLVLTKRLCKLFRTRSDHVAKKILPKNIEQSYDLVDKKTLQTSFNKEVVLFTKRLANKFKQRSDHVDKKKKSKPC